MKLSVFVKIHGKAGAAKELGVSRGTIYNWLSGAPARGLYAELLRHRKIEL